MFQKSSKNHIKYRYQKIDIFKIIKKFDSNKDFCLIKSFVCLKNKESSSVWNNQKFPHFSHIFYKIHVYKKKSTDSPIERRLEEFLTVIALLGEEIDATALSVIHINIDQRWNIYYAY